MNLYQSYGYECGFLGAPARYRRPKVNWLKRLLRVYEASFVLLLTVLAMAFGAVK